MVVLNWNDLKNLKKYLYHGSAHELPMMPKVGLKSLKAITTPYIGLYEKHISRITDGSNKR